MEKDNYQDAYDSNTAILNAGDKGSGLQNDVFADSAKGGFEANKFFRAEGAKKLPAKYEVKGYFKVVFPADKAGVLIDVFNADSKKMGAIGNGKLIYNYGIVNPKEPRIAKVMCDGKDFFIALAAYQFMQPVGMLEAQDMIKKSASEKVHVEGMMNAAGVAKEMDKGALSVHYKALVANVNGVKKALNERKLSEAKVYVATAKKHLSDIEKLLK